MKTDRTSHERIRTTEKERLACLRRLGILKQAPEQVQCDLIDTVAHYFRVPMAFFSLIDSTRQVFRTSVGLDVSETSRSDAFCRQTILGKGVFVVQDARKEPGFANNPLVTSGPLIRFYAGAPVLIEGTHAIGALCIADREPRSIDKDMVRTLAHFSFILACMIVSKHHTDSALRAANLRKIPKDYVQ